MHPPYCYNPRLHEYPSPSHVRDISARIRESQSNHSHSRSKNYIRKAAGSLADGLILIIGLSLTRSYRTRNQPSVALAITHKQQTTRQKPRPGQNLISRKQHFTFPQATLRTRLPGSWEGHGFRPESSHFTGLHSTYAAVSSYEVLALLGQGLPWSSPVDP